MREILKSVFEYGSYTTIGSVLAIDISFHMGSIVTGKQIGRAHV